MTFRYYMLSDLRLLLKSDTTKILYLDNGEWEPEGTGECGARVWCPDLLHEGQWHHIAIVLNRAVLKNSSFSLYLDGQHIHSQKVTIVEIGVSQRNESIIAIISLKCSQAIILFVFSFIIFHKLPEVGRPT